MAIKTKTASMLVAAALLATVAPQLVWASGASVSVTADVTARVTATATDGGVRVQANTPWQLSVATVEDGVAKNVVVDGDSTGAVGTIVPVEGAVEGYTLVPR